MTKRQLAVLCGGKSAEHEISLLSARNILEAVNRENFAVTLIGIDKHGRWFLQDEPRFLDQAKDPRSIKCQTDGEEVVILQGRDNNQLLCLGKRTTRHIDVAFPILHGPHGEDGTIQGLLKLAGIPFVGADVLGSAICMDKIVTKRLLKQAGIATADFLVACSPADHSFKSVVSALDLPFFVKPAALGSSVGISKVKNDSEYTAALETAFRYDSRVIIERAIIGREVECSVLGNEHPQASLPGEIICHHEFYSYAAKYLDDNGASIQIPAKFASETVKNIQNTAIAAYQCLGCEGMARVDFFIAANDRIYINELNTIPGFTAISMYPKLWRISGLDYTELIDRLIEAALERHQNTQAHFLADSTEL